jgi:hypothetical protein
MREPGVRRAGPDRVEHQPGDGDNHHRSAARPTISNVIAGWPLTGRDEELRRVVDTVLGDAHRGVLIAGNAGVGKTRLAREAATDLAARGWAVRRVAGTSAGRPVVMGHSRGGPLPQARPDRLSWPRSSTG